MDAVAAELGVWSIWSSDVVALGLGGRTFVIGFPAKEMRFRPQRQTDSVVILWTNGVAYP